MKGGRRSEVDQVGRMREARQGRREGESWVLWQQWMGEGQRADSRTQELRPRVQARGGGWRDGTKGGRPARASPGILLPPAARCPSPACRRGKKRSLPSIQQSRVESVSAYIQPRRIPRNRHPRLAVFRLLAHNGRHLSCALALIPRRLPPHRPRIALPSAHLRIHCRPHSLLLPPANRRSSWRSSANPRNHRLAVGGNSEGRAQEQDESLVKLPFKPRFVRIS